MNSFWFRPYKNLPSWFWTHFREGGWENFSRFQIPYILAYQPHLHPHFDLSKFSGDDIAEVLQYQPQLHPLFDLNKLDGWEISKVLINQPQLHTHFDLNKLNEDDIAEVMAYQPQLHPHFDLNKLSGDDIVEILDINYSILLWLDDFRNPTHYLGLSPISAPFNTVWVKNYHEFVSYIKSNPMPEGISFDHDLGDVHYDIESTHENWESYYQEAQREMTGYDCAKWLCEYCLEHNIKLPVYSVHSANTVGRVNIQKYLENFCKNFPQLSPVK